VEAAGIERVDADQELADWMEFVEASGSAPTVGVAFRRS